MRKIYTPSPPPPRRHEGHDRARTLRCGDAREFRELLEEEQLQRRRRRDTRPHGDESAPERERALLRRDLGKGIINILKQMCKHDLKL